VNGRTRILSAFRGERPDTAPILLHNFMMAAREAGITMREFRERPEAVAKAFIQAVERYGYDGVLVDVDTVTLAGAAGVPVDLPEDEPARVHGRLLNDLAQAADLPPVSIATSPRVSVWLEATRLLKKYFGDEIAIRGNCDQAPFTLAGLIRGMDAWLMDLLDPACAEHAQRLLEYCSGITLQFLRLMAASGADILSNGDSSAGPDVVSPALYRRFALPWERKIVDESHRLGLPYVLHICGNAGPILDDMLHTGADGLELDHKTDASLARTKLGHRTVFIGNIDPSGVLALGTPAEVRERTISLRTVFADTPRFILNAGCAIPATTPAENLRSMISASRGWREPVVGSAQERV
jgi:MtaA/CmuA family methyltransferase